METERIISELQKLNTRVDGTDAVLATLDGRVGRIEIKVDGIMARLDGHDHRFEALDRRLEQKFEAIDKRFEQVDKRFEGIEATLAEHGARMDTFATRQDVHDEGERTRNYMRVLYEDLRGQIGLIAEGHASLAEAQHRTDARLDSVEQRTTLLEIAERDRKRAGN